MQSAATIRDSRPATTFIWFVVTQVYAVMGAWAAFAGTTAVRGFALSTAGLMMLVPLLINLQWGLTAMLVFEPLRGFLRRLQYLIVPYSDTEPIHLLTPAVTLVAFLIVFRRFSLGLLFEGALTKAVTVLGLICFLQIFNPLQGGPAIGLMGALYMLVPMAWFYFARDIDEQFFPRVLRLIAVLAVITSMWGVYQISFGYPAFEQYWIDNTDGLTSIAVYNVTRAIATFSNAEEWGRYTLIGAVICFGLFTMRSIGSARFLWFAAGIVLCFMLMLSGQRTSIFGLMLAVAVLVVTGTRSIGSAFARIGVLALPLVILVALSGTLPDMGDEFGSDQGVSTMIYHTQKGTIDPTSEGSLDARFRTWTRIVTEDIPSNPLGSGLGLKAVSSSRKGENQSGAIDNHFLTLAISAGLPAMLLLVGILFGAGKVAVSKWLSTDAGSDSDTHWRIALALLSSFMLNNFFGTSFAMYSIAPIGWFLIGWIARRDALE